MSPLQVHETLRLYETQFMLAVERMNRLEAEIEALKAKRQDDLRETLTLAELVGGLARCGQRLQDEVDGLKPRH